MNLHNRLFLSLAILLAVGAFAIVARFVPLRSSLIPVWNEVRAKQELLNGESLRSGDDIKQSAAGEIAQECLDDFATMKVGDARISRVYSKADGRILCVALQAYRDAWYRRTYDRELIYFIDARGKRIVCKVWSHAA